MGVMAPTTSYTPPPQRRVTEIPNLNTVRASEAENNGKRLSIGKHIKVSGEVSGCERLVVEGEINATMHDVNTLEIASCGRVGGKADVDSAVVAGSFDGTLIVRGHLEIPQGGSVCGTISYKSVTVANGGKLSGTITILD
ncbi:MAG: polymer-forming cytoskeletal protein [Rhodospirillaceae bacterium]|nr:polymer-forming cytoskeletal protein [Rhodospirillaceae bacterium]